MEYICLVVAKKLCRPMVSISISGLKATSGSGDQIFKHFDYEGNGTGDLSEATMEMKTFHVLTRVPRDRGHREITACSHLCQLFSL